MWNIYFLFVLILYAVILDKTNGYDTPANPQYHIQTDEGPERYFRYQTLSGQYRKEKRLEDGTVIGTYAWIDDDGMLRQQDYLSDNEGYRITKSKNVYVGKNMPVGDAIKFAKKYPASSGTSVSTKPRPAPPRPAVVEFNKALPPQVSTPRPVTPQPIISTAGTPCATCSTVAPTTYRPDISYFGLSALRPHVEISNNALPSATRLPSVSSTEHPYIEIGNPSSLGGFSTTTESSNFGSSTGLPLEYLKTDTNAINNLQYQDSSTARPVAQFSAGVQYSPSPYDSLPTYTESDQNSLDYNPYVSSVNQGFLFHNGPTYPIDRNGHTYRGNKRYVDTVKVGNGYDEQFPKYDGVSVTNDGFRYYIPRAYHEEQNAPNNEKTGSFGYIDPFGIRRVIYYNAKPGEGFKHRKNNRYVGLDATPYDPRPY